jgi:DNA-binding response OmpR family regulator
MKILIIEDDPLNLKTLQHSLTPQYQVITANDGKLGLSLAKSEKPNLIILDLMLPNLDGLHITRLLKFDNKYQHIPIIILTAKTHNKEKEEGKNVGADLYITKPYDLNELLTNIKELIKE